MSNEPIALMFLPTGAIKPYKIKPFGQYFIIDKKGLKGLFRLDPKHKRMWGKTACYFYDIKNMNPFDPVIINELNHFLRRQKLTKIKKKDVRLSKIFRNKNRLKTKENALDEMKQNSLAMKGEMENAISLSEEAMEEELKAASQKKGEPVTLTTRQHSIYLLQYLESKGLLPPEEKDTFIYKIENQHISFDELVYELTNLNLIEINEPMSVEVDAALEDFGAQDPVNMLGHINDLIMNKKGLRGLTSTPVKSFIPAATIFAIGMVIIMAIAILPGQIDTITGVAGDNGFKLPFGLGG